MSVHVNQAAHVSVEIAANYETAFAFLADVTAMPRWAVNFISAGRAEGETYWVTTPMGEMPARIEADAGTGVISMLIGPMPPFVGVLSRSDGGCTFTFLLGKQPSWSTDQFRTEGIPGMVHECEVLAGLVEAIAA